MTSDQFPDAKRPRLDAGPSPPVDDALAKLRQAAQSAIDSVTMSMLGAASASATPVASAVIAAATSPSGPSTAATAMASATPKLPTLPPVAMTSVGRVGGVSALPAATAVLPTTTTGSTSVGLAQVPSNGSHGALGLPGNLGLLGRAPAASLAVPPGVLAELQATAMPQAIPSAPSAPLVAMQAHAQALAAGKLGAIEAMARIEPAQPAMPQVPKLQPDTLGSGAFACGGAGLSQPPAEGADNQAAAQMYMLAQLAEESAHTAVSAAACLNGAESDPTQVAALAEAAQQAATRATWAATSLATCFPAPLPGQLQEDEWTRSVRNVTAQASEAAEQAALTSRIQATDLANRIAASTKSKVPCKWFLLGQCRKGICEFSHDIQDLQPRPLHKKRAEECVYFQKGQCTRGTACPFAHGPEELAEIARIVSDLKGDKRFVRR